MIPRSRDRHILAYRRHRAIADVFDDLFGDPDLLPEIDRAAIVFDDNDFPESIAFRAPSSGKPSPYPRNCKTNPPIPVVEVEIEPAEPIPEPVQAPSELVTFSSGYFFVTSPSLSDICGFKDGDPVIVRFHEPTGFPIYVPVPDRLMLQTFYKPKRDPVRTLSNGHLFVEIFDESIKKMFCPGNEIDVDFRPNLVLVRKVSK